jgi:hypothetical protein
MMIIFNLETLPKKVGILDIHGMQDSHHLFFIGGFSQVPLIELFDDKG